MMTRRKAKSASRQEAASPPPPSGTADEQARDRSDALRVVVEVLTVERGPDSFEASRLRLVSPVAMRCVDGRRALTVGGRTDELSQPADAQAIPRLLGRCYALRSLTLHVARGTSEEACSAMWSGLAAVAGTLVELALTGEQGPGRLLGQAPTTMPALRNLRSLVVAAEYHARSRETNERVAAWIHGMAAAQLTRLEAASGLLGSVASNRLGRPGSHGRALQEPTDPKLQRIALMYDDFVALLPPDYSPGTSTCRGHHANLTSLKLSVVPKHVAVLELFGATRLTSLQFSACWLGDAFYAAVAALPSLATLAVTSAPVDPSRLGVALAAARESASGSGSASGAGLRTLQVCVDIGGPDEPEAGLRKLCRSAPALESLFVLVHRTMWSSPKVFKTAFLGELRGLRSLEIIASSLDAPGVVAELHGLSRLTRLALQGVTDSRLAAPACADRRGFPACVAELELDGRMSVLALQAPARPETLRLRGVCPPQAAAILSAAPTGLRSLALCCGLDLSTVDVGVGQLASLTSLRFDDGAFDYLPGVRRTVSDVLRHMPNVKKLDLGRSRALDLKTAAAQLARLGRIGLLGGRACTPEGPCWPLRNPRLASLTPPP